MSEICLFGTSPSSCWKLLRHVRSTSPAASSRKESSWEKSSQASLLGRANSSDNASSFGSGYRYKLYNYIMDSHENTFRDVTHGVITCYNSCGYNMGCIYIINTMINDLGRVWKWDMYPPIAISIGKVMISKPWCLAARAPAGWLGVAVDVSTLWGGYHPTNITGGAFLY